MSKPTVLFIHGSWHQPAHWAPIRKIFEEAGYPTACPLLPSFAAAPTVGLKEDALSIREELDKLIGLEKRDIIVVGHSYGGAVMTQAADESLAKKQRSSNGQRGGIVHLLYIASFILPLDCGIAGFFGGSTPPYLPLGDDGMCIMDDPAYHFYHDLPEAEQKHWVSLLKKCPNITQTDPVTYIAYRHHPSTYLFATEDQGLPYAMQQAMVQAAENTTGISIGKRKLGSSHSPFLSMPERVFDVVESIRTSV